MSTPPLLLERSFYDVCEIEAVGDQPPPPGDFDVDVAVAIGVAIGEPSLKVVRIEITTGRKEPSPHLTYRIRLGVVGFFRMASGLSAVDEQRFLAVTGASILYSGAREYLLAITGRCKWGAFQLPTISFPTPAPTFRVGEPSESVVLPAAKGARAPARSESEKKNRGRKNSPPRRSRA